MKRLAAILCLLAPAATAAGWEAFRGGTLSVVTSGDGDEARRTLGTLVQLRHTLGEKFGRELEPVWPLTVVHRKGAAGIAGPALVRESYLLTIPQGPIPPEAVERIAALLIRENTAVMEPEVERGVARVFSTLAVDGARVTLGAPPAARDLDWARMHLLLTDPRYSGTARVLLSNFAKGVDAEAAWRNTTGKPRRDFDKEAAAYLAAGRFGTIGPNSKPFDPRRTRGEDLETQEAALLEADLAGTVDAYRAVAKQFPELAPAKEAIGVLTGEKAYLEGATGPRALAALGTMESLEKAWRANPRWAEPHEKLAGLEARVSDRAQRLRKAAELAQRDVRLWQGAAQAFEEAELPAEAARMWYQAERAAPNAAERERLHAIRRAAEQRRLDAEAEERRRVQEAEARELQRLKDEAANRIREAEARANAGGKPASGPVVEWWDGPRPDGKFGGRLLRVDCLGNNRMRLAVGEDLKTARVFAVPDAGKLIVTGTGTADLGCGLQKTPRLVTVEFRKAGNEAVTVTFGK